MHKPQFDGTPSTEEYRAYLALLLRDTFIGRAENLPLARATHRKDAVLTAGTLGG